MAPTTAKQPLSTEPTTKRIHVGGLAPSVSAKDLVQRFSSFGTIERGVEGVEGLGQCANGAPRNYAFFTLETTEAKFQKCMSMLNGSMWKAHKLRIAPAKPHFEERRVTEREEAKKAEEEPAPRPKKRKRSKDPNVGMLARHFELVTEENLKRHRGWVLDPKPSPTPLFPLLVRPPHPLEGPAKAAATAWTRGKAKAKPSKAAREAARLGVPLEKPALRRAKRMRIDPRRWGRVKMQFNEVRENEVGRAASMLSVGTWECEEVEREEGQEPMAVWVFKAKDGSVKLRETVRLSQRTVYTDNFTAIIDRMLRPPTTASAAEAPSAPVSLPAEPSTVAPSTSFEPLPTGKPRARSTTPPPYIPSAPRTLIYNEEDAFQLVTAALPDAERDAQHEAERKRLREVALGVVAEVAKEEMEGLEEDEKREMDREGKVLPKVEGFADDSEDDSDLFPSLRLRGGGGVSSDSDSDSDSSSDSSDSNDEEESESQRSSRTEKQETGDEEDAKMDDGAVAVEKQPKKTTTTLVKDSLKDMFKPQEESAGFSLFDSLDLDVSDLDDSVASPSSRPIPLPEPEAPLPLTSFQIAQNAYFSNLEAQRAANAAGGGGGPSAPFFAFPSGEVTVEEATERLGLSEVAVRRAEMESRNRLEGMAKDFWRVEEMDTIEAEHQKLREALRGNARKRHREAVKRSKKTAGRRGQGLSLDIVDDDE
ncbi:hypothetical protein JCM8547_005877 [Rhodosporidiobolus lusitaniae]